MGHVDSTHQQVRDQVFISYSHRDKRWLEYLLTFLTPHVREESLDVWVDTRIRSGAEWKEEIDDALARARVAVLLVSPYFLASAFIAKHELPPLLEAQKKEGLTILWVAVSASAYDVMGIDKYQSVNTPSRPLDTLTVPIRNRELVRICKEISSIAKSQGKDTTPQTTASPNAGAAPEPPLQEVTSHQIETTPAPRNRWTMLTKREIEVLGLVRKGLSNREIADQLFIRPSTVEFHLVSIYRKLDVNTRTSAVSFAIDHGLL